MSEDAKEIIKAVGDELRDLMRGDEGGDKLIVVEEGSIRQDEIFRLGTEGYTVVLVSNVNDVLLPNREAEEPKHVRIETLGCGEITCPVEHITLHMVGGTHRLLVRDDVEWREISVATYYYIKALLNYA